MRLALDHPGAVTHLAVLDGVPIGEALARADARFAALWWHWFFLGQTDNPAERVINADPQAWYGLGDAVPPEERAAIYDMVDIYGDPLAIWREWADDVQGVPIESGHHVAEENPAALTTALRALLRR